MVLCARFVDFYLIDMFLQVLTFGPKTTLARLLCKYVATEVHICTNIALALSLPCISKKQLLIILSVLIGGHVQAARG